VLLDLMLPGISGFDVLRRMAEITPRPRVIVVSARDAESDIVRALDLGAHDYVRKPFGLAELLARVKAQLREHDAHEPSDDDFPDEYTFADVRLALRRFRLWKGTPSISSRTPRCRC
jgi:two-component system KDP operon response regulator KdpE